MAHRWFEGSMQWDALKAHKFRPPYLPDIEHDEDASNFSEVEETPDDAAQTKRDQTLLDDAKLYAWCEYF